MEHQLAYPTNETPTSLPPLIEHQLAYRLIKHQLAYPTNGIPTTLMEHQLAYPLNGTPTSLPPKWNTN